MKRKRDGFGMVETILVLIAAIVFLLAMRPVIVHIIRLLWILAGK